MSYTWGNSVERIPVYVNGAKLEVAANAHNLLKARSSFVLSRVLWIDSICTNQDDEEDKSQQIQLMGEIYRRAFLVTVWLNKSPEPKDFVEEIGHIMDGYLALDLLEELRLTDTMIFTDQAEIYRSFASQRRSQRWFALIKLMNHPWFERMWVVQEVALANTVRVIYAEEQVPWQTFIDGLTVFSRNKSLAPFLEWGKNVKTRQKAPISILTAPQMNEFRQKIQRAETLSFSQVLFDCHRFKATNKSDKIFAIQGIYKTPEGLLSPNYSLPLDHIYLDSGKSILKGDNNLHLLTLAGIGYFLESIPDLKDLPSWIPDWSRAAIVEPLRQTALDINYKAGGKLSRNITIKGKSLILGGRLLDTIEELGLISELLMNEMGKWNTVELIGVTAIFTDAYKLATESPRTQDPYLHNPSQSLREAYWRSLIGDRTSETRPAPASLEENFNTWEKLIKEFIPRLSEIVETDPAATDEFFQTYKSSSILGQKIMQCSFGRRFCVTEKGYIGHVPAYTHAKDVICVFPGVQTPMVLRSTAGRESEVPIGGRMLYSRTYGWGSSRIAD